MVPFGGWDMPLEYSGLIAEHLAVRKAILRPLVSTALAGVEFYSFAPGTFEGIPVTISRTGCTGEQKKRGAPRKLAGFAMTGRGIARHGYPVYLEHRPAGHVTSGTYAPFLQKSIGLCYPPAGRTAVGTSLDVDVRGRRVAAKIIPTPFYERPVPVDPTT